MKPIERKIGGKLPPGPATFGGPPSLKNIKHTRMHHLKKFKKNFSPERPPENVSPSPAVPLGGFDCDAFCDLW